MSKSLSAYNQTATDTPHADLVRLVKIEFTGASPMLTVYLCDRTWGSAGSVCVFNGQIYEPLIIDFGSAARGRISVPYYETEPGEFSVTIDNSVGLAGYTRFTAIFADYPPQWAVVTESYIFNGASSPPDEIDSFKGYVEDILDMSPQQVTLAISSYELGLSEKFSHTIVNTTTYSGADPDEVGKMVPQVYGRARRVPAIAADAGGKTTLVGGITSDNPTDSGTLQLTDATAFPSSGAFTIQIDEEQIRIASRSGNTLTLESSSARGYGGTTADAHVAGADVWEIQSVYVYILADHPVDAVDAVYVDGVRQDASESPSDLATYTGKGSDEYAGYSGKAVAVFTVRPKLERQINIDVAGLGAADGGHVHSVAGGGTSTMTARFESNTIWRNTVYNPSYIYDNNTGTSARFYGTKGQYPAVFLYRTSDLSGTSGTPTRYRFVVKKGTMNYQKFRVAGISSNFTTDANDSETDTSGWITLPTQTWAWVNTKLKDTNQNWVERLDVNSNDCYLQEYEIEIEYEVTTDPVDTGYAAVSITGGINSSAEVVIGRQVAADLQGRIDDGSGTYTGSANALIERPGHIIKHILISCCGLTASEIDATSYSAADSYYNSNSYRLAVPILQKPNIRELVNRICAHCCSLHFWEAGEHHIDVIGSLAVDSYTKLLLHFDGSDGSTTIIDSGYTDHGADITCQNDAQIDTAQYKFSEIGSSLICENESGGSPYLDDCITIDDNYSDLQLGSDIFGIDFWVRLASGFSSAHFCGHYAYSPVNTYWAFYYSFSSSPQYLFFRSAYDGTYRVNLYGTATLTAETWHHLYICRGWGGSANQFAICLDGSLVAQVTDTSTIPTMNRELYIGADRLAANATPSGVDGHMAEFRMVIGNCPWTTEFTPPTKPYPFGGTGGSLDSSDIKSIEANRIDLDQFYISYTPRSAIRNKISATFKRDWSGHTDNIEAEQELVQSEDSTSQASYGTLEDSYSLPYIIDSAVAQDVADWMIDERKDPRLLVEFSGGYYLADIERGDLIAFTESVGGDDDYLDDALLRLISYDTDLFRVLDVVHRPDNSIQIQAVKI